MRSLIMLFLGQFVIYFSCTGVILTLYLHYICVCVDIFVHRMMVFSLICLCMLYNVTVGCTSSWVFCPVYILCMGYYFAVLLLHLHFCSYVCEFLSTFTVICWCNSYNHIIGCTPSWEACPTYFLYVFFSAIVAILIELHAIQWINIYLFGLVGRCIETNIFVPSFSIAHDY